MCKFESSQKDESRWQSTDSSKAYRNTGAFKFSDRFGKHFKKCRNKEGHVKAFAFLSIYSDEAQA